MDSVIHKLCSTNLQVKVYLTHAGHRHSYDTRWTMHSSVGT